jgi:hypothetical protein
MASHRHNRPLSEVELRVKALESLLTEKGHDTRHSQGFPCH